MLQCCRIAFDDATTPHALLHWQLVDYRGVVHQLRPSVARPSPVLGLFTYCQISNQEATVAGEENNGDIVRCKRFDQTSTRHTVA